MATIPTRPTSAATGVELERVASLYGLESVATDINTTSCRRIALQARPATVSVQCCRRIHLTYDLAVPRLFAGRRRARRGVVAIAPCGSHVFYRWRYVVRQLLRRRGRCGTLRCGFPRALWPSMPRSCRQAARCVLPPRVRCGGVLLYCGCGGWAVRYVFGSRQLDIVRFFEAYARTFQEGDEVTVVCEQVSRSARRRRLRYVLCVTFYVLFCTSISRTLCRKCAGCGQAVFRRRCLRMSATPG